MDRPEETLTAAETLRRAAAAAGIDVDRMELEAADAIPDDEFERVRQEAEATRKQLRLASCSECGAGIKERDRNVLAEVVGWSAKREQGGQNHVIARRETGRWMCGDCATRLRAGLAPAQETLL